MGAVCAGEKPVTATVTTNHKTIVVSSAPPPTVDSPPPPTTMTTPDILDLNTLPARDPMICFRQWFDDVQSCDGVRLPTSASLATANRHAIPSVRVVGVKGFDEDGFKIATNGKSRKAVELDENPFGSLMFYWEVLNRMVRIDGPVTKLPTESADNIWKGFPRAAQLTHGASNQDTAITSKAFCPAWKIYRRHNDWEQSDQPYEPYETVLSKRNDLVTSFPDITPVPRNPDWCAYNLVPELWEFYQASDEVPDRLIFRRPRNGEKADGIGLHTALKGWVIERWSP